jgi:hypothetical protein
MLFSLKKPNFWRFIKILQEEQLSQDQLFNCINEGGILRPRAFKYRRTESVIREARTAWENQNIDTIEFLSRVSVAIASNTV